MITATKALIVFCEGPHDIAFCELVFKGLLSAKNTNEKFAQYPAPFNLLFKNCLEKHAAKDLSLDMAHKFFLPDKTLVLDDWIVLLFNAGGKEKPQNPRTMLADLFVLLENVKVFSKGAGSVIVQVNYLFLYDADDGFPNEVFLTCKRNFGKIEDVNLIPDDFVMLELNKYAAVCGQCAVYVWAAADTLHGTLEDSLLPILMSYNPTAVNRASAYLLSEFQWKIESAVQKERIAEISRFKKATITLMGQGKKPGGSMNVIISQTDLFPKSQLAANKAVKLFADFIGKFTGLTILTPQASDASGSSNFS